MNQLEKNIIRWQRKPSERKKDGVFIVEGIKMALEVPVERLEAVVVSDSFIKENRFRIAGLEKACKKEKGIRFECIPDSDYKRLSDTKTPQGILAVLKAYDYTPEEILREENGFYVFLENLQDPGNLGTIIRSAEAAGCSGVILNENSVDPYNPKVIRATMGSFFRVKFAVTPDLRSLIREFREDGGTVYAAHLQGSVPYDQADYRKKCAVMIGNESKGLSDALTEAADLRVHIPMKGKVESLNAAMAATILMFESMRQRKTTD